MIAVARGKVTLLGETLGVGDVAVVTYPEALKLEGAGLVVVVRRDFPSDGCHVRVRPAVDKRVVRARAPELRWANGTMTARSDTSARGPRCGRARRRLRRPLRWSEVRGTCAVAA